MNGTKIQLVTNNYAYAIACLWNFAVLVQILCVYTFNSHYIHSTVRVKSTTARWSPDAVLMAVHWYRPESENSASLITSSWPKLSFEFFAGIGMSSLDHVTLGVGLTHRDTTKACTGPNRQLKTTPDRYAALNKLAQQPANERRLSFSQSARLSLINSVALAKKP